MTTNEDVTLLDVYRLLGEVQSDVRHVVSKTKDHETRLRSLEIVRNWAAGVAAAASVGFGLLKGGAT
ncbi:hypothetical protein UFOVP823_22 [uncultured Caudovirales phage]|uniref:Uncharacterized protein n=1 Tax=uncultured Caudovirales phage TaxID=2100421 RepID=A0A6J5P7T2_9CAUD|nr:hypothetical protein UFOVP823_22 [uncultured Caudovirales phage]